MEYIDDLDRIRRTLEEPWAAAIVRDSEERAAFWLAHFDDSPQRISGWGHDNVCTACHSPLRFDIHRPEDHVCTHCGRINREPRQHAVWVATYRGRVAGDLMRIALLYRLSGRRELLEYMERTVLFYARRYAEFPVHGEWVAKGRIMWQSLEEAGFAMSLLVALEMVKGDLGPEFRAEAHDRLFRPLALFTMDQPEHLVNIRLRIHSSAGMAALFFRDEELFARALDGTGAIRRLLRDCITEDGFWQEMSFHYHFYALQAVTEFLLFCRIYGKSLPDLEEQVRKAYRMPVFFSYRDMRFPTPSDGWPFIGLHSYVRQYEEAARLFPAEGFSTVVRLVFDAGLARKDLQTLLFGEPEVSCGGHPAAGTPLPPCGSIALPATGMAMLRSPNMEVFLKWGNASASHSHFDRMTIEIGGVAPDASNIGYGSPLHGSWYMTTAAHNTVCVDGRSHERRDLGRFLSFDAERGAVSAEAPEVHPGVLLRRSLLLDGEVLRDRFETESDAPHVYDWIFHCPWSLEFDGAWEEADLGHRENGWQHVRDVMRLRRGGGPIVLRWTSGGRSLSLDASGFPGEVFRCTTIGNPPTTDRHAVVLRQRAKNALFETEFRLQ